MAILIVQIPNQYLPMQFHGSKIEMLFLLRQVIFVTLAAAD